MCKVLAPWLARSQNRVFQTHSAPCFAGIPLNFSKHQARKFALSINSHLSPLWSQQITVDYPGSPELFVKVPMPKDPAPVSAADEGTDTNASTPQNTGISLWQAGSSKSFIVDKKESADVAQQNHQSVVLRASMQVHSPGCLHIVLHSIGCEAPYLLQNRTSEDFVFRQEGSAEKWHILCAYSAIGFAWPHADGAVPQGCSQNFQPLECNTQALCTYALLQVQRTRSRVVMDR